MRWRHFIKEERKIDAMGDKKKEKPKSGGCFCGAIRYAFYGYPAQVLHCHCKTCRKLSGNAFSTIFAVSNSQIFLRKESMLRKFRSSTEEVRGFCVKCGCCIFIKYNFERNTMWLFGGTINGTFGVRITGHIFTKDKAPWYEINDDLPQCEGDDLWIKDASDPVKNLPDPSDIIEPIELISDLDTKKSLTRQDSGVRRKGDLIRMHNLVKTEDVKIFRSLSSSSSEESVDYTDSGAETKARSIETIHEEESGHTAPSAGRTPLSSVTDDEDNVKALTNDTKSGRVLPATKENGPNTARVDVERKQDDSSSLSEYQLDSTTESSDNDFSDSKPKKDFWV